MLMKGSSKVLKIGKGLLLPKGVFYCNHLWEFSIVGSYIEFLRLHPEGQPVLLRVLIYFSEEEPHSGLSLYSVVYPGSQTPGHLVQALPTTLSENPLL